MRKSEMKYDFFYNINLPALNVEKCTINIMTGERENFF